MRLLLLLALAAPAAAQPAGLTVEPAQPVAGEEATIRFDAPVDTLLVTHRPNSALARQDTIAVGGFDAVRWTFRDAGVVQVAVPGGPSKNVSVRFSAFPAWGLLIMIGAGTILFGGAAFAMTKLLGGGPPETRPELRPDT